MGALGFRGAAQRTNPGAEPVECGPDDRHDSLAHGSTCISRTESYPLRADRADSSPTGRSNFPVVQAADASSCSVATNAILSSASICDSHHKGSKLTAESTPCSEDSISEAPTASPSSAEQDETHAGGAIGDSSSGSRSEDEGVSNESDAAGSEYTGELDQPPNVDRIRRSIRYVDHFWTDPECVHIEKCIDWTVAQADFGLFTGQHTVDKTAQRGKYFFGHGYTYGQGRRGKEELLPPRSVDPIPVWVYDCLIQKLERTGTVPKGWINSVVMNDYRKGSSIVAHIDPPQLFARPILTATFFSSASLVFGASFDPQRTTQPAYSQLLERGCLFSFEGYAANRVTHGIRPEDLMGARRVSIVFRHVLEDAPRKAHSMEDALASAQALVCHLSGFWQDAIGEGSRVYHVNGQTVHVFGSAHLYYNCGGPNWEEADSQALAMVSAVAYSNGYPPSCHHEEYRLEDLLGSVSLNGMVLRWPCVFHDCVRWQNSSGQSCNTWLRVM